MKLEQILRYWFGPGSRRVLPKNDREENRCQGRPDTCLGGGTRAPSVAQLRNFAAATKRPLAVFNLSQPPLTFEALHDFRAGATAAVSAVPTPGLAFEVRKAYDRREWAFELMSDLQLTPTNFEVRLGLRDDPEVAAEKIRAAWGVA